MKYIEIQEFTPPAGLEYVAGAYPHEGLFMHDSGTIVAVGSGMVMILSGASKTWIKDEQPSIKFEVEKGCVSESTFLKALAIMREPGVLGKIVL